MGVMFCLVNACVCACACEIPELPESSSQSKSQKGDLVAV